jgi:hypothetical protein
MEMEPHEDSVSGDAFPCEQSLDGVLTRPTHPLPLLPHHSGIDTDAFLAAQSLVGVLT